MYIIGTLDQSLDIFERVYIQVNSSRQLLAFLCIAPFIYAGGNYRIYSPKFSWDESLAKP